MSENIRLRHPTTVERAFELARSGMVHSVADLRRQLKAEFFEAVDIHLGGSLSKQLSAIIEGQKLTR